jgi:decaprenylphospho-beta-D-erythro-pentofuranosid-2-ulose 2-reductase
MNILVVGANSMIAQECCRIWSAKGHNLHLISRDLPVNPCITYHSHHQIQYSSSNFLNLSKTKFQDLIRNIDLVFIAYGTLTDNERFLSDRTYALEELDINLYSKIALINSLIPLLKKGSKIAVINSVAGSFPRKSNFSYGMHKSAISFYLQGLSLTYSRNLFFADIRPGFIISPMTENFKKNFLWTSSKTAAKIIIKGIDRHQKVIFVPWYWRLILFVLKIIPNFIFSKLNI